MSVSEANWQQVWRNGIVPVLTRKHLEVLKEGLEKDDPRLIQGATVMPHSQALYNWPAEAACALGYCGWIGDGLDTVDKVEKFFGSCCFAVDQNLGQGCVTRYFLNWFDETPREEMRRLLLEEVNLALETKGSG